MFGLAPLWIAFAAFAQSVPYIKGVPADAIKPYDPSQAASQTSDTSADLSASQASTSQPLKVVIPNPHAIKKSTHATDANAANLTSHTPPKDEITDDYVKELFAPEPVIQSNPPPSDNGLPNLIPLNAPLPDVRAISASGNAIAPSEPSLSGKTPVQNIYQSPAPIIKKEVLHMRELQPELVQSLTPQQLAQLAPSTGENISNAPLIQPPDPTKTPSIPVPTIPDATVAASTPPLAETSAIPSPEPSAITPLLGTVQAIPAMTQATPNTIDAPLVSPPVTPVMTKEAPVITPPAPIMTSVPITENKLETINNNSAPMKTSVKTLSAEPLLTNVSSNPPVSNPPAVARPVVAPLTIPASEPKTFSSEPQAELSPESKSVIKKLNIPNDRPKIKTKPVAIDHAKEAKGVLAEENTMVDGKGMGIKVQVKKPEVDMDYELEKAYDALSSGHSEAAMDIYKNVLANDPKNVNALFGLATLYHRAGQIEMARPLYAKLLTIEPNNRDGLNNFLVLLADEAPEEATTQMEQLEQKNPGFSPIPAQLAIMYEKQGNIDKANEKMLEAVNLSPENLTYRYNLAIMLDKQKKYAEAAKLYRQIIEAYQRGEVIPGNLAKIQQRLTFISSNRP